MSGRTAKRRLISLAGVLLLVGCGPAIVGGGIAGGILGSGDSSSAFPINPNYEYLRGQPNTAVSGPGLWQIEWVTKPGYTNPGTVDLILTDSSNPSSVFIIGDDVPDLQGTNRYDWDPMAQLVPDGYYRLKLVPTDASGSPRIGIDMSGDFDGLVEVRHLFLVSQQLGNEVTWTIELGDVDGDLDLDVVTGNGTNQANRVWLNDGNAVFTDSGQSPGPTTPMTRSMSLGDLDGLPGPDLAIGQDTNEIILSFNDGSGTFTDSPTPIPLASVPLLLVIANVDGGTDNELLVLESSGVRIYSNNGSGTLSDSGQLLGTTLTGVSDFDLGDVDGDSDLDLVCGSMTADEPVELYLNDGNGTFTFQQAFNHFSINANSAVTLGDFDGDGDLDVGADNSSYCNDGSGFMQNQGCGPSAGSTFGVVADFGGDSDLDLLDGYSYRPNEQGGPGHFRFLPMPHMYLPGTFVSDLAVGHLDTDGHLDAVTAVDGANLILLGRQQ